MIEVLSYKAVNKGCLKGTLSLQIPTEYGKLIIRNVGHFGKDDMAWLTFPQKEYMAGAQKRYIRHMLFEEKEYQELFQKDALKALEAYEHATFQAAMDVKKVNDQQEMPF